MTPRVFIADDRQTMLDTLRRELERDSSLQVCGEALNGAEAVAKVQELRPDLVIFDLAMPIMNGLEAAGEISKIIPGLPIFLYTLTDIPQVRAQAAVAGIREVISKSSGIRGLRAAIQAALKNERDPKSLMVSAGVPPAIASPGVPTMLDRLQAEAPAGINNNPPEPLPDGE